MALKSFKQLLRDWKAFKRARARDLRRYNAPKLQEYDLRNGDFTLFPMWEAGCINGVEQRMFIFRNLDLSGARFAGLQIQDSVFINCNLRGADFTGVEMRTTTLGGSDLTDANFTGAVLENCPMSSATLLGSVWENAKLDFLTQVCTYPGREDLARATAEHWSVAILEHRRTIADTTRV